MSTEAGTLAAELREAYGRIQGRVDFANQVIMSMHSHINVDVYIFNTLIERARVLLKRDHPSEPVPGLVTFDPVLLDVPDDCPVADTLEDLYGRENELD